MGKDRCSALNDKQAAQSQLTNGKKKRRRILRLLAISFLVLLIITGVLLSVLRLPIKNSTLAETPQLLTTGDAVSEKLTDIPSAISALAKSNKALGYENALSELSGVSQVSWGNFNVFRLQQYYGEIPVLGKTVSVLTDTEGTALLLSGNVQDISEDSILNQKQLTEDEAQKTVSLIFPKQDIHFYDSEGLCLFESNGELRYAYDFYITLPQSEENQNYHLILDAQTGDTLVKTELSDTIEIPLNDEEAIEIQKEDGSYPLMDTERGIYICDCDGKDSERNNPALVTSEDGNFDSAALTLLEHACTTYDHFHNQYGDFGLNKLAVCYNDGRAGGKGAFNDRRGEDGGTICLGTEIGTSYLDVIAHEYTHLVTLFQVGWQETDGYQESDAINEGLSDLFGVLVEAYGANGGNGTDLSALEPDWMINTENGVYRNIKNPEDSGNAAHVQDKMNVFSAGLIDVLTGSYQNDLQYFYSTVVSHAAYRMWADPDGDGKGRLTAEELSDLWYQSMIMFPNDVNFVQCRAVVEINAAVLHAMGKLTDVQLECIVRAFDAVGITSVVDIKSSSEILSDTTIVHKVTVDGRPLDRWTQAISDLESGSFSLTIQGQMTTDFVDLQSLDFKKEFQITNYGQIDMAAKGSYAQSSGSEQTSYTFTYSDGTVTKDYTAPYTGNYSIEEALVDLSVPVEEVLLAETVTVRDDGNSELEFVLDSSKLTKENSDFLNQALPEDFSIYWAVSPEWADTSGVLEAEITVELDASEKLKSIQIQYILYGGIQDISRLEGKTVYTFNNI